MRFISKPEIKEFCRVIVDKYCDDSIVCGKGTETSEGKHVDKEELGEYISFEKVSCPDERMAVLAIGGDRNIRSSFNIELKATDIIGKECDESTDVLSNSDDELQKEREGTVVLRVVDTRTVLGKLVDMNA